tara:strand:+ start:6440 stop:6910 length:471 start_codon:yes stop_codon:yes gene_type:complete
MHLTIDTTQFNCHNVMISDKTKNNIMSNSDFYRIYFSNDYFTLNGISISFTLYNLTVEKYFNKIKCNFDDSNKNQQEVEIIKNIEKNILEKYNDINIKKIYRIDEQLSNHFLKLFDENKLKVGNHSSIQFQLKISGIWSQSQTNEYGLTFRFFVIK